MGSNVRRGTRRRILLAAACSLCGALVIATPQAQQIAVANLQGRWSPDRVAALRAGFDAGRPYVPGEVLVKFRRGTSVARQQAALSVAPGRPAGLDTRRIGDLTRLRFPLEPDAEHLAALLRIQPDVEYAQPNYLMGTQQARAPSTPESARRAQARPRAAPAPTAPLPPGRIARLASAAPVPFTPNDTDFARQWNFDMLEMPLVWAINRGGSPNVIVAVVDSGITTITQTRQFLTWTGTQIAPVQVPFATNPDLTVARFTGAQDFVFFTAGQPVLDMEGHGTLLAGTIAQSTNNNLGVAGMADRVQLMPLKACFGFWEFQFVMSASGIPGAAPPTAGGCPTDAVVDAIRHAADRGAHVINLSLGGPDESPAVLDAIQYAVSRGSFVAISAGNSFENANPVNYPAAYATQVDGAVSVGAVGPGRQRAYYSSTGPYVTLAAPGGDVREGLAGLILQVGLFFPDFDPASVTAPRFNRYALVSAQGTSIAAPHVAGAAALLVSQGVRGPAAIEAALKRFALDLGTPGFDHEYGHGLIRPRDTLRGLGLTR